MNRDRVIDALRVGSLLVVVLGHWLMASVAVVDGRVTGSNSLVSMPGLHPLTWVLQVMPLFFVAGGFANLTVWRRIRERGGGYPAYLRGRTTRLLGPVLVFALLSQVTLGIAWAVGVPAEDIAFVGRLLGRPLWFLVVYLLVTAAAPLMAAWHERAPVPAILMLAAGAVVVDLARIALGAEGPAYLNFLLVWLVAQQLGFWYADGRLSRLSRAAVAATVAGVVATLVGLTVVGPYPVSMIGLPDELSNMSPPSVCLMLLALGQTMMVMLVRPALGRWLERPRVWAAVVVVGARAMTIYLWHRHRPARLHHWWARTVRLGRRVADGPAREPPAELDVPAHRLGPGQRLVDPMAPRGQGKVMSRVSGSFASNGSVRSGSV